MYVQDMWITRFKFASKATGHWFQVLPVERQHCPQVALFGVQDFDGDFVHPGTAPALDCLVVSHHPEELESTWWSSWWSSSHFLGWQASVSFETAKPVFCCSLRPSNVSSSIPRTLAFAPELPLSSLQFAPPSCFSPVWSRQSAGKIQLSPCRASTHRFHRWDPPPRAATNVSCRFGNYSPS